MNEKSSTTMSSRHKKRGIIIGCAIGGVAAIALSVGLGVGLTSCGHIKKFETGEKFGNWATSMANKKDPNLNLTNSNMNDTVAAIGPKIDSSIYWYMNCLEKAEIIINYSHQPSNTFELNKLQVNTKKQTMDWDFKIDLIQPDNKGLVSLRTRGSNKYFISDGLYRINRNEKETWYYSDGSTKKVPKTDKEEFIFYNAYWDEANERNIFEFHSRGSLISNDWKFNSRRSFWPNTFLPV